MPTKLTPWQEFTLERLNRDDPPGQPSHRYDPELQTMFFTTPEGARGRYQTRLRGPQYKDATVPAGSVVSGGLSSREDKLRAGYPEFVAWLEAHGYTLADHWIDAED